MSTATKTKRPRKLNVDQKLELARELTEVLGRKVDISFRRDQEMDYGLWEDNGAKGHQWECEIPEIDNNDDMKSWWLDDRNGDILDQIAESLEDRGNLLLEWSKRVRKFANK